MAIARDTTAANIKPLDGSVIQRRIPGAAVAAGEFVYLDSAGKVQPTNGGAVATNYPYGVAVQAAAGADGPQIDIVVFGPVQCLTGATIGAIVYTTDTAGEPGETAGTKTSIMGVNHSATVLFVRPQIVSLS